MAFCVAIHASGVTAALSWLRGAAPQEWRFWNSTRLFVCIAGWVVLIHLVEIAGWAFLYFATHAMPDLQTAFYFSGVTYTTTGYGDLVLPREWRLVGGVEALTGILMCGWSTGFFLRSWAGCTKHKNPCTPKRMNSLLKPAIGSRRLPLCSFSPRRWPSFPLPGSSSFPRNSRPSAQEIRLADCSTLRLATRPELLKAVMDIAAKQKGTMQRTVAMLLALIGGLFAWCSPRFAAAQDLGFRKAVQPSLVQTNVQSEGVQAVERKTGRGSDQPACGRDAR